jgi:oxygen-dependent protoporphyrinogen oxidase
MLDSLIVGAGLSGLTVAHTLQSCDRNILVAEANPDVGGNIISHQQGEFLWEEGPNSFQPNPTLLKLAVDVGLKDDLVFADRKLPRWVYWQGRLLAVPMSPGDAVRSPLLSLTGKLRALFGALGFVPPLVGKHIQAQGGEETIWQFINRHLGSEVAERLISPFVSGVYAGDVHALSMAAAFRKIYRLETLGGGLVAGAMRSRQQSQATRPTVDPNLPTTKPGQLGSFREGMAMLPKAIAARLGDRLRCHWTLTQIERLEQGYRAHFDTPDGGQTVETRTLVLAIPAHRAAPLLAPLLPALSTTLNEIPYPAVACTVMAYPTTALVRSLHGFGNLNPRSQGIRTLGTIWSSTLFPGRAPEGWVMLSSFIGGSTDPAVATMDEDAIAQAVHQDLSNILVKPDSTPKVLAVKLWSKAIPQYTLGHCDRLTTLAESLKTCPGLTLCSNYTDGVALGDCIRRGIEAGDAIDRQL